MLYSSSSLGPHAAPEKPVIEAPGGVVEEAHLLGFEGGVGALDVAVELGGPADGGAHFGVVACSPLGEHGLIADDVGDEIEQAVRHLFLDNQVRLFDDDLFADIVEGHEYGGHPQHPLLDFVRRDGVALSLVLFFEQGAVGDVAGLRGHVKRAVKLVEAAVDELQAGGAPCDHAVAEIGDEVAGEGEQDGEGDGVLPGIGNEDGREFHGGLLCLGEKYTRADGSALVTKGGGRR